MLFIVLVRCPVHTPVRMPMYGLPLSQSDGRIRSVFQSVYNKPVYLGHVILGLSKLVMDEFHHDYMIPKYSGNLKLCYKDSLVYHIKTKDFYSCIAEDV